MFRRPLRIKRKKSILKNRFFWLAILVLIILGGIFYFLFFSKFFQLKNIIITGTEKVSSEKIKPIVENESETKTLFLKTKSIFLVNLNKIKNSVLDRFPQIGEIKIKRVYPNSLKLEIIERKGIGIFCKEEICLLIDKEGIIFESASTENQLLKIKNPTLNQELKLGDRVLEKELLTTILEIETKLNEDLKIPSKETSIVSDEKINIKTLEGWEIYFNPQRDINWQLTKLGAVLEKYLPPEKRENLQYIDLRFGDRAFYK